MCAPDETSLGSEKFHYETRQVRCMTGLQFDSASQALREVARRAAGSAHLSKDFDFGQLVHVTTTSSTTVRVV